MKKSIFSSMSISLHLSLPSARPSTWANLRRTLKFKTLMTKTRKLVQISQKIYQPTWRIPSTQMQLTWTTRPRSLNWTKTTIWKKGSQSPSLIPREEKTRKQDQWARLLRKTSKTRWPISKIAFSKEILYWTNLLKTWTPRRKSEACNRLTFAGSCAQRSQNFLNGEQIELTRYVEYQKKKKKWKQALSTSRRSAATQPICFLSWRKFYCCFILFYDYFRKSSSLPAFTCSHRHTKPLFYNQPQNCLFVIGFYI